MLQADTCLEEEVCKTRPNLVSLRSLEQCQSACARGAHVHACSPQAGLLITSLDGTYTLIRVCVVRGRWLAGWLRCRSTHAARVGWLLQSVTFPSVAFLRCSLVVRDGLEGANAEVQHLQLKRSIPQRRP